MSQISISSNSPQSSEIRDFNAQPSISPVITVPTTAVRCAELDTKHIISQATVTSPPVDPARITVSLSTPSLLYVLPQSRTSDLRHAISYGRHPVAS
jgi:hypothetical protein